jgi:cobaltochelatase CobS
MSPADLSAVREVAEEGTEQKPAALAGNGEAPRRAPVKRTAVHMTRTRKNFSVRAAFGIDLGFEEDANGKPVLDTQGKPVPRDRDVEGYADKTEFIPAIDPSYVFPNDETRILLLGMTLKDNVLLVGETGTGKTSLIEQVAARLNYNVVKINFDGHITRQDLIGEWVVKGREMQFQYGILVMAFQMPGTIIIFDEWDTISAECSFVLQRPLQKDDRKILIMETGGELVQLHPENCLMATANTCGQGDDTGLYSQGTRVQNYAQLNRFSLTIRMKYLAEEKEVEMIGRRFPDLHVDECKAFVKAINAVREGYINGQISAPLSPRDLINWAEKYLSLGEPTRAARYCFLNRMPEEDATVAEGIIQRVFSNLK